LRVLGSQFDVRNLSQESLQNYISARQKERTNRGTTVSPTTIRKEMATLSAVWSWAPDSYKLNAFPNKKRLRYAKTTEKPPFQTWTEIETQIARGGLSEEQEAELWDCLFLSLDEMSELSRHVHETAIQPFIYPMVVTAAHTGARRSELVRSRVADFQDETLIIREAKRVKGKRSTRRVPVSTPLSKVLHKWLQNHPGGQFMFCQDKANGPTPLTRNQAHDHFKRTLSGSKWGILRGWHVLRHSFVSNCALKGLDQRIIDSFVGHNTDEMRRRYTHLFPSATRHAIKSVFG
jgi:integrase